MNKEFAWQIFKNTGNLDAYLIMREYEENEQINLETNAVNFLGEKNGIDKNEGNSN